MLDLEFKGTKNWYLGLDKTSIHSTWVDDRLLKDKYKELVHIDGEICQCWADLHDGKIISDEECRANATMIANTLNMFDTLKRVKQYLIDNSDVLAPFPNRSEIDNINNVLKQSIYQK